MEKLKVKVKNLVGASGREVPNQFEIEVGDDTYFQSYDSVIVCLSQGKVYLDEKYWDYSVTTSKYRNKFLGRTTKEIEDRIKSGVYELTNLN